MKKNIFTLMWVFFFIFGFSVSAFSSTDVLLQLTDIEGESKIDGYEGWIYVLDLSWEVNNNSDYSLRNPKDLLVGPIMLRKYVDKASPELFLNVLTGGMINEAILVFRKGGEDAVAYAKITLSNVIVSYLSPSVSGGDDRITEYLGLNFKNICYEYTPQNEDGSVGAAIERCWSR